MSDIKCLSGSSSMSVPGTAFTEDRRPEPGPVTALSDGTTHEQHAEGARDQSHNKLVCCEPSYKIFESVYKTDRFLGQGSFGTVFSAVCKSDGQQVAVKSIWKLKNNTTTVDDCKLNTDVVMMATLQQYPTCPYVIQMFEWFDYPDHIKVVMEYPHPCTELVTLIMCRELDIEKTRIIMCQAVEAVKHCLDHGIFHNDIHAGNILVNTSTFNIKLIDFGCAMLYNKEAYQRNKYRGAKLYRPPEVKSGNSFDGPKTNVYQLGRILERMSSGLRSKECRELYEKCQSWNPSDRPTFEDLLKDQWLFKPL